MPGSSACLDNIDGLKALDLEFEDLSANNTRKEILRIEKILKDESMWSGSNVDMERFKELEKLHDELLKKGRNNMETKKQGHMA